MPELSDVWNNELTAIPALDLLEVFTRPLLCQALTALPNVIGGHCFMLSVRIAYLAKSPNWVRGDGNWSGNLMKGALARGVRAG